jgi:hypothetical protein
VTLVVIYVVNLKIVIYLFFFEYPITKVVWCVVVICFHQSTRPANYDQFWTWITKALPGGDTYICWDLLQYVGQYGRPGTKFSLRKNI